MNMSKYIFKLLCITAILGYMSEGYAQSTDSLSHRKLDTRQHQGYTGWKRIVPTHVKAQYAGGMGVMSVGGGWDYGQKCRWETDLLVGYLPQRYSDAFHVTFTLKQNYIPWSIRCHERFSIDPLTASMYINLIAGDEYWVREPDRYGGSYYRFTTRMRLHMGLGQRATYHLRNPQGVLRSISLYYEFHTYDLDMIAKCTNRKLKLNDIVHFSFGLKFHLLRQ